MDDVSIWKAYDEYLRESDEYTVYTGKDKHLLNINYLRNQMVDCKKRFRQIFSVLKWNLMPLLEEARTWVYVPELKGTILVTSDDYYSIRHEVTKQWEKIEWLYKLIQDLKSDIEGEQFLYEKELIKKKEREVLKIYRKRRADHPVFYPVNAGVQLEINFK